MILHVLMTYFNFICKINQRLIIVLFITIQNVEKVFFTLTGNPDQKVTKIVLIMPLGDVDPEGAVKILEQ